MDQRVTETGKEADGDITAMGGPWGTASKAEAIRAINNGWIRYYVQDHQGQRGGSSRPDRHVFADRSQRRMR